MANEEHLTILKKGVAAWNLWREGTEETPDLTRADLSQANLSGANLIAAKLNYANLSYANLADTNLFSADLRDVNLVGANLISADLRGALLHRGDLSDADLILADFGDANLTHANVQNARAGKTTFANCDLSEVKGLALIYHQFPSTIGIDAIYKSKGKIPESFLYGCGVPESFIAQLHSLVGAEDGIQFYSCFISYSSKDEEFAQRLHGRMRDAHLRVWFARRISKAEKNCTSRSRRRSAFSISCSSSSPRRACKANG